MSNVRFKWNQLHLPGESKQERISSAYSQIEQALKNSSSNTSDKELLYKGADYDE